MNHILIIEDEERMAKSLEKGLVKMEYRVSIKPHGLGINEEELGQYDLIILDWMLPGISGVDLLKSWRQKGLKVPVLMLTAKAELMDKVQGLEWGADDYMSKFFEWPELLARIKALIRRTGKAGVINLEGITLDKSNKEFFENDIRIPLTPTEYQILMYFFNHPRQVVSRTQLVRTVYDHASNPYSNVIERHIKSIRQKCIYDPILTVRGFGYRLRLEPTSETSTH